MKPLRTLLLLAGFAGTAAQAAPPLRCPDAPNPPANAAVLAVLTEQQQRCTRYLQDFRAATAVTNRPRHPAPDLHRAAAATLAAATRFVHDAVRRSWPDVPPAGQAAIATAILTGPDGLAAAAHAAAPEPARPPAPAAPPAAFTPLDTASIAALAATGAIRVDDVVFPLGPPASPDLLAAAAAAERAAVAELRRRQHAFIAPAPPGAAPRERAPRRLAASLLAAITADPARYHIHTEPACSTLTTCPFARLLPGWLRAFRAERRLACGNPAEEPPLPIHLQRRCAGAVPAR